MSKNQRQSSPNSTPSGQKAPDCGDREAKIRAWFGSWLERDGSLHGTLMTNEINYVECTGDEYNGIDQIGRWFGEWLKCGVVRRWDIKSFTHLGATAFVEWYFECFAYERITSMDGISVIDFADDGRMCRVREFSAEHEHNRHDD